MPQTFMLPVKLPKAIDAEKNITDRQTGLNWCRTECDRPRNRQMG